MASDWARERAKWLWEVMNKSTPIPRMFEYEIHAALDLAIVRTRKSERALAAEAVRAERERLLDMLRNPSDATVKKLARAKAKRMSNDGAEPLFHEYTPLAKTEALVEIRNDMTALAAALEAHHTQTEGE